MHAFFSIGFRSMFAAGTLFAAISLFLWGQFWLMGDNPWLPAIAPFGDVIFWHQHELIMGMTLAILAGFLLTAVQNWTRLNTASPFELKLLLLTWIAARAIMLFHPDWNNSFIILSQMVPGLILSYCIAKPIIKRRMLRNYFAPLAILAITLIDSAVLYQVMQNKAYTSLIYSQIMIIFFVVSMIAGRIIPFFMANKLSIEKVTEPGFLKYTVNVSLLLVVVIYLAPSFHYSEIIQQMLFVMISSASFARLYVWYHPHVWQHPMLLGLWISYALFALGFLLMGFSHIFNIHSIALHVLLIGALGGMLVSMISRVSLGHSGRSIQHDRYLLSAFFLLILSLVGRTLLLYFNGFDYVIVAISACLGASAFAVLFLRFIYIWYGPRPDTKKGIHP